MSHTYVDIQVQPLSFDGVRKRAPIKQKNKRTFTPYIIIGFGALSFFLILVSFSHAGVTLAPQTCLGGFVNPGAAAGSPSVADGDPAKFTDENSASVTNALADIFCGDFTGDIPKDTKPTAITASFSWALVPVRLPEVIPASAENLASSTTEIIDAAPDSVGTSLDQPTEAQTTEPMLEPEPPIESAPETEPEPSQAEPQSLLSKAFAFVMPNIAHAETLAEEASSTLEVSTTTPDAAPVSIEITEDPILEVSYTLDGADWHTLGTVTRSQLALSSFVIPADSVPEWSDLARLQIRVKTLSAASDFGTFYLDGVTLTVEYEKTSVEVQELKQIQETEEFVNSLPDIELSTSEILNSSSQIMAEPITMGDGKKGIRYISKEGGTLLIYKGLERSLFMNTGIGNEPLEMPLYLLPPDTYTVLNITNLEDCSHIDTIDECRAAPSYRGEVVFSVTVAPTAPVTSSNDIIQK